MWCLLAMFCFASAEKLFVTRWEIKDVTQSFRLPMSRGVLVDWGENITTRLADYNYSTAGVYTITMNATVTDWDFKRNPLYRESLLEIISWGYFTVNSKSAGAFYGCRNLIVSATDQPIFTAGATLESFFEGASQLNSPLSWDTSQVTSMYAMFSGATLFNSLLNFSTTSQVISFGSMFASAWNFNMPVNFDTSAAQDFSNMFSNCSVFNQPLNFVTSAARNISGMFKGASNFNQQVNFDTTNVVDMSSLFLGASVFNSNVTFTSTPVVATTEAMFKDARAFNQPLNLSTGRVTTMKSMFEGASAFNRSIDFETKNVISMESMFASAYSFNNAITFDTTSVRNMDYMFLDTSYNLPIYFITGEVTSMRGMFEASNFNQPLDFDTSNVVDTRFMFRNARSFNQILNFDTQKVKDMRNMFDGADQFTQNLASWNTSVVQRCDLFCEYCGLPVFESSLYISLCKSSFSVRNSSRGWSTCNCMFYENKDSCAAIPCIGPAYVGEAGNCRCALGYSGTVVYDNNSKTVGCEIVSCNVRSNGPPGNCICQEGYAPGNIYVGNTTAGCGATPFSNTTLTITALRSVTVKVLPHGLPRLGFVVVHVASNSSSAVNMPITVQFFNGSDYRNLVNVTGTNITVTFPVTAEFQSIAKCKDGKPADQLLTCYWRTNEFDVWSSNSCATQLRTNETVCNCPMGQIVLGYPELDPLVDSGFDLKAGVLIGILLAIVFPVFLALTTYRDHREKQSADKETSPTKVRPSLCELQNRGFRHHHTLCCLPEAGIWFKTVDRLFISFMSIFIILGVCNALLLTTTELSEIEVALCATAITVLPKYGMTRLIKSVPPQENTKATRQERHPAYRWFWYAVIVLVVVGSSVSLFAVERNPCFDYSRTWLIASFISYAFLVLVLEPMKVAFSTRALYYASLWKRRMSTEMTIPEIAFIEVELVATLGQGAFGRVDQCVWRGADWAIKRLLNPAAEAEFFHEVSINRHLLAIKHTGVASFVGLTQNPHGILLELYPLRSVEDYVIKKGNLKAPNDLCNILTVLIGASSGVMHLHVNGVVHRDLAARNFLIKQDLTTAVCDFGLALLLPEGKQVGERTQEERKADLLPVNTSAPETLRYGIYSASSDTYMFGHFIWELFARQGPHQNDPDLRKRDMPAFARRVCSGELKLFIPSEWPEEIASLIRACCALDPTQRPNMEHVNITLRDYRKVALTNQVPLPTPIGSEVDTGELNLYNVSAYQDSVYGGNYDVMPSYGVYVQS